MKCHWIYIWYKYNSKECSKPQPGYIKEATVEHLQEGIERNLYLCKGPISSNSNKVIDFTSNLPHTNSFVNVKCDFNLNISLISIQDAKYYKNLNQPIHNWRISQIGR